MDYVLTLTLQEIQTLGTGLGELPFKQSAPLITKIQTQIKEQEPKVSHSIQEKAPE